MFEFTFNYRQVSNVTIRQAAWFVESAQEVLWVMEEIADVLRFVMTSHVLRTIATYSK